MLRLLLLMYCLTCVGHARRMHTSIEKIHGRPIHDDYACRKTGTTTGPVNTLATLLLAFTPAATFSLSASGARVVYGHCRFTRPTHTRILPSKIIAQADDDTKGFDRSQQQFDPLSFRTFRRDTILQYDATNQSEPLRIALTLLGILFGLSVPSLGNELRISDENTLNAGAALSTIISGILFARNRGARQARLEKIEREYAMGDLMAVYRGFQKKCLRELRGKNRIVVLFGTRAVVSKALAEAFAYRRRLVAANAIVVPIYSDETKDDDYSPGEAESRWRWAAARIQTWKTYFEELLSSRSMSDQGRGAWVGLNDKGRTFGSSLGMPRWDELLGTGMQPSGDGFGELSYATERSTAEAADEGAKSARALSLSPASASAGDHAGLLAAQAKFYDALTNANVATMQTCWTDSKEDSALDTVITEAVGGGARIEPWEAGSSSFPPAGMQPTDPDAIILSTGEGWTTAVERPQEGGTLLATQRWQQDENGAWRLKGHQYIPWSADGATAILTLRCDKRGCVLFGREINKPAP